MAKEGREKASLLSLSLRTGRLPNILLLLMGTIDCITTVIGVMHFGAVEYNPFLSTIISSNISAFVALKLSATVLVYLLFGQVNKILSRTHDRTSKTYTATKKLLKIALIGVLAFLIVVVSNNLIILATAI